MSAQPFLRRSPSPIVPELCIHGTRLTGAKARVPIEVQEQARHAVELFQQGQYTEAEKESRAVLAALAPFFGPEDAGILLIRDNLASTLCAQGKLAEGVEEHRVVLAIWERTHGPDHGNTVQTRTNLAKALNKLGKYAEAEKELRTVLAIWERQRGAKDVLVLEICHDLALTLVRLEKLEEALELAKRTEKGFRGPLGIKHAGFREARTLREEIDSKLNK